MGITKKPMTIIFVAFISKSQYQIVSRVHSLFVLLVVVNGKLARVLDRAVFCTMYSKWINEDNWSSSMFFGISLLYGIILLFFIATFDMFFIYFSGNISQILIVSVRGLHAIYRIYTTRDSTVFNVNDNVEFMMGG